MVNKVRAVVIDAVRNNARKHSGGANVEGTEEETQNGGPNNDDEKVGPEKEELKKEELEKEDVKKAEEEKKEDDDDEAWISKQARRRAVRKKYLSWNAASAAQAEIIEFLEELVELAKLIVGANEFRSGVLARRRVFGAANGGRGYAGATGGSAAGNGLNADGLDRSDTIGEMAKPQAKGPSSGGGAVVENRDRFADTIAPTTSPGPHAAPITTRRRGRGNTVNSISSIASGTGSAESRPRAASGTAGGGHVPVSLMRIQSRKREAVGLRRVGTGDEETGKGKGKGKAQGGEGG